MLIVSRSTLEQAFSYAKTEARPFVSSASPTIGPIIAYQRSRATISAKCLCRLPLWQYVSICRADGVVLQELTSFTNRPIDRMHSVNACVRWPWARVRDSEYKCCTAPAVPPRPDFDLRASCDRIVINIVQYRYLRMLTSAQSAVLAAAIDLRQHQQDSAGADATYGVLLDGILVSTGVPNGRDQFEAHLVVKQEGGGSGLESHVRRMDTVLSTVHATIHSSRPAFIAPPIRAGQSLSMMVRQHFIECLSGRPPTSLGVQETSSSIENAFSGLFPSCREICITSISRRSRMVWEIERQPGQLDASRVGGDAPLILLFGTVHGKPQDEINKTSEI
ncbi:hypothetical protein B0H21DRAFT_886296 [Amylocystis lapponica]|nr:hypothetical protein B0H21DRAFT_886296 [Amylocystis lapponica]